MSNKTSQSLAERIDEFNRQFDYGEYHDKPHFWISMLEHQVNEAWDAMGVGDEEHAYREAADAVLVAFQFMESCGNEPAPYYIRERMENAEDRGIDTEIVPKYLTWYNERYPQDKQLNQ